LLFLKIDLLVFKNFRYERKKQGLKKAEKNEKSRKDRKKAEKLSKSRIFLLKAEEVAGLICKQKSLWKFHKAAILYHPHLYFREFIEYFEKY
jgi:hypothetical protein